MTEDDIPTDPEQPISMCWATERTLQIAAELGQEPMLLDGQYKQSGYVLIVVDHTLDFMLLICSNVIL